MSLRLEELQIHEVQIDELQVVRFAIVLISCCFLIDSLIVLILCGHCVDFCTPPTLPTV